MVPECTAAVLRALDAAQCTAALEDLAEVQLRHLLAGLLADADSRAVTIFTELGLDANQVREAFAVGTPAEATTPALPLAARTQDVLAQALELAAQVWAERTISSEPLLVALLQSDPALVQALEPLGLDQRRLQAFLQRYQAEPLELDAPLDLGEPTAQIDAARIFDASANRVREALRVIEDYCRFVLDDAFLSGSLKQLRHDFAEALERSAPSYLLQARETQYDVGTAITTEREQHRQSLRDVVQANLKRLQEALRSLEEVSKLHSGELGHALERLRYCSYTLERAILLGADARQRLAHARLYVLLTGANCTAALDWTIQEAAAGGASIFQLREKHLNDRDLLARARQVRRWTRQANVLFIMNDRPDIARLAEADGVHVGQDELPVKDVRRIVGPDLLIGVSTHNLDQLHRAILDGAAYVGIGPTFTSGTKAFAELAGLDFVKQATAATTLPAFIIGGVTPANLGAAVAAGARRVAVSQAICQADDPRGVAAAMIRQLG